MQDNKASRIFLIVAVVLGVLATVMAFAYIDSVSSETGGGPKIKIMVAALELRPNQPLDPGRDLQTIDIPAKFQPFAGLCLTPNFASTYKGQKVARRVLAGQPVMIADMSAAAELTIKEGNYAMSLPVKGAYGVSGLPVPGDRVKVLVTQPTPGGAGLTATTLTIGGKDATFRVVAVGSRLTRYRQPITAAEQYNAGSEAEQSTVTIEVNDAQAKEILDSSAAFRMPITLILLPPANPATQPESK